MTGESIAAQARAADLAKVRRARAVTSFEKFDCATKFPLVMPTPMGESRCPDRTRRERIATIPNILFLLAVAAGLFWLTWFNLDRGEVRRTNKPHTILPRTLTRTEHPVLFWTSITMSGGLGGGCVIMAAWLIFLRSRGPRN